jgi:hypothetical protein
MPRHKLNDSVSVTTAYNAYTIFKLDSMAYLSLRDSLNTSSKQRIFVLALKTNVQAILFNSADNCSNFDG